MFTSLSPASTTLAVSQDSHGCCRDAVRPTRFVSEVACLGLRREPSRHAPARSCRGYTFAQSKDDISGTCLIVCVRNNTNPPDFQQHWLIVRSLHTFCRRRHFRTFSGPDKLMVQPLDPHVFSALSPDLVDLCGVQLSLVWHRPAKSCRSTLGRIEDDDASDFGFLYFAV